MCRACRWWQFVAGLGVVERLPVGFALLQGAGLQIVQGQVVGALRFGLSERLEALRERVDAFEQGVEFGDDLAMLGAVHGGLPRRLSAYAECVMHVGLLLGLSVLWYPSFDGDQLGFISKPHSLPRYLSDAAPSVPVCARDVLCPDAGSSAPSSATS